MKPEKRRSPLFLVLLVLVGVITVVAFFSLWSQTSRDNIATPETPDVAAAATTAWTVLLEQTPVAYTTPLPEPVKSPLDGTYTKIDQSRPQWWLCLRCADYRRAGGIWKLQFDQGIMRVYYEVTGWKSIASYTVSDDRLILFNDPYCRDEIGEYLWTLAEGSLKLDAVADTCSFNLRAENLGHESWSACLPAEATDVNDQAQNPPGCTETITLPTPPATPANLPVTVTVDGGDSRLFEQPPELFAPANSADTPPPPGIAVTYHQESIPYGLNRVVWWNGDWIEASTELPFTAMGVQFFGGPALGWARVLFDGVEVWRGDTSAIGSDGLGHYGGYINISDITPGKHTIRVESLGFDYHPVTVSSFGFSYQDVIKREAP
jgi:hypothetical protein